MAAPILIKKYGNRRLYDTGDSKYVTLEELAVKVRNGADLRVVDAQTNEDLTQATLAQIVMEGSNASRFLPVQLLTQMIRLSDDSLAEFFSRYVTGALDMYLQAKRYNPLAVIPDALGRMWGMPQPQQYAGPPQPQHYAPINIAPPPPPEPEAPSEVAQMRSELDELKQMLRESMSQKSDKGEKKKKKS